MNIVAERLDKPAPGRSRGTFMERLGNELRLLPVALGLLALVLFFATQSDVFLTSRNINNLLIQSTVTGIIAVGLVFVLLVGEIDLSVAATSGVASVLMSKLVVDIGMPIPVAIGFGIMTGVAIGAASGRWITLIGVPSFVVTLGVGLVLNGVQLLLLPRTGRYNLLGTGVENIAATFISGALAWVLVLIGLALFTALRMSTIVARRRAWLEAPLARLLIMPVVLVGGLAIATLLLLSERNGLPMPLILFVTIVGIAAYVTTETRFGLHLYAVGNSVEAARRSGINVARQNHGIRHRGRPRRLRRHSRRISDPGRLRLVRWRDRRRCSLARIHRGSRYRRGEPVRRPGPRYRCAIRRTHHRDGIEWPQSHGRCQRGPIDRYRPPVGHGRFRRPWNRAFGRRRFLNEMMRSYH